MKEGRKKTTNKDGNSKTTMFHPCKWLQVSTLLLFSANPQALANQQQQQQFVQRCEYFDGLPELSSAPVAPLNNLNFTCAPPTPIGTLNASVDSNTGEFGAYVDVQAFSYYQAPTTIPEPEATATTTANANANSDANIADADASAKNSKFASTLHSESASSRTLDQTLHSNSNSNSNGQRGLTKIAVLGMGADGRTLWNETLAYVHRAGQQGVDLAVLPENVRGRPGELSLCFWNSEFRI